MSRTRFAVRLSAPALALAALSFAPPTARAQMLAPTHGQAPPPGAHPPPGPPPPGSPLGLDIDYTALTRSVSGEWANYAVAVPGRDDMPVVRYALLTKTPKTLSIEIDAPTPKGEIDVRIDYLTSTRDVWTATAGKMRFGDKVMEMPPEQVLQSLPVAKNNVPGELVGTEDIKTPVGTFPCRHYHRVVNGEKGGQLVFDLWMNEKIGPTGLVKSTMGPMTMTLAATGTGATTKIP